MTQKLSYQRNTANRLIRKSTLAEAVSAAIFASVITAPVMAQTSDEVITVTATKSNESIQEVPLAITALSGEFMDEVNLNDVKDLVTYTPGISGNSQDSFIDAISVRGIRTQDFGVGGDPSTAFFKNDMYEGRNGSAVSTLFDMDRAEILRGPQGFLFGRNSIAGAVSVHTRKAELDTYAGSVDIDIAERGHRTVTGAVNVPVNDVFAMRFAGITSEADGFVKNQHSGQDMGYHDKYALRWSTAFEDGPLTVNTMVEYENREQAGSLYRAIDKGDIWDAFDAAFDGSVAINGSDETIDSDIFSGNYDHAQVKNYGVKLEYDFGDTYLTSSTGYKDHDYYYSEDYDGTTANISNYKQDQKGDYFQQELRLNSNTDGPLSWYIGASYYKEKIDANFAFIGSEDAMCSYYGYYYWGAYAGTFSGCSDYFGYVSDAYNYYYSYYGAEAFESYYGFAYDPELTAYERLTGGILDERSRIKGKYSGWASYVNVDYAFNDKFNVELGLRYTSDKKDFSNTIFEPGSWLGPYYAYGFSTDGALTGSKTWTNTSFRALARYKPVDDVVLYASFTEGYKSGGFGSFSAVMRDTGDSPEWNAMGLTNADAAPGTFRPEIVDSYEFGYKDIWMDGNVKFDLTGFYYEYQDLQVIVWDGGASLVKNVGEADAMGFETSIKAKVTDNLNMYFAYSYLDSEANKLQDICGLENADACDGSSLFWAPESTYAFVLDGNFPLDSGAAITTSLEMFSESERGGGWEGLQETKIDSFVEMNARIGYQSAGDWYVEAYVENLNDEFTWDGINNNGGVLPSHFFGPKRPRTFGVRLGMSWE